LRSLIQDTSLVARRRATDFGGNMVKRFTGLRRRRHRGSMVFAMACGQCDYVLTTDEPIIMEEARRRLKEHDLAIHHPAVGEAQVRPSRSSAVPPEPGTDVDTSGRLGPVGRH
jgi:hypothetical protein